MRIRPGRLAALCTAALSASAAVLVSGAPAAHAANGVPQFSHIVVAVFENHSYAEVLGGSSAPYMQSLANNGARFTQSFAIEHPSEPNYLDLFSGSNQGVTDDSCPHDFATDNEGAELIAHGFTFGGYSETMPSVGYTGCTYGTSGYARKHNPWVNFDLATNSVPSSDNMPFTSFPTSNFASLPTVSWVVPNLCNDMHDCSVGTGDTWAKNNLDAYAQWAKANNSLLIITFDEDDSSAQNNIPTLFYGANVKVGTYGEHVTHYNVLRTLEDAYGTGYAGASASATPITDVWTTTPPAPLSLNNPGAQTGTTGTATSLQLAATGGSSPYTFTATGLPAGLTISSSGLISGTPTTAGTYTVNATVTDSVNATASTSFTWTINQAPVTVTNPGNQSSPVSKAITPLQLTASGGASPYTFTATGLPTGLTISSSGLISGTPTARGTFTVTATATDSVGATGSTTFNWSVRRK